MLIFHSVPQKICAIDPAFTGLNLSEAQQIAHSFHSYQNSSFDLLCFDLVLEITF